MTAKRLMSVIALGFSLIVGSAVPAVAFDHDDGCRRKVQKAELELDKAVRKHGEHSRQAQQKRERLERVRANCHWDRDRH